jgi:hypothetical protein
MNFNPKKEQLISSDLTSCNSPKPKLISIGVVPTGYISIGIVPMGIIAIGIVPMGVISFGTVAMGAIATGLVSMGIVAVGGETMGLVQLGWQIGPVRIESQPHNHQSDPSSPEHHNH